MTDERKRAARELRNRAIGLLARREHSRRELSRKLSRANVDAALVDGTLDRLAEQGLQSDERFAAALVRRRAESGHGPLRVLAELKEHGIAAALAEEALAASETDWCETASAAREKRFGPLPPDSARDLARQMRFLQYRGFTSEQVRFALRARD